MIVCSCGVVFDTRLIEAARSGMSWREARKLLNVTNNPKCCRCAALTKPMFIAARRAAGFEDHPLDHDHLRDSEHNGRGEKQ